MERMHVGPNDSLLPLHPLDPQLHNIACISTSAATVLLLLHLAAPT